MKKLFITMLVALCATLSFAQSSLLATLSHEGEITSYYGTNALKEAYNAAENGDVITLSSGQFNAVDIEKAITVRGAGHNFNAEENRQPTIISGNFHISAPEEETTSNLILEGLYHNYEMKYKRNIKNVQFIKCRFKNIGKYDDKSENVSISLIQCRVNEQLFLNRNVNMTCINSYIYNPYCYDQKNSNIEMQNCVIYFRNSICSSLLNNCIVVPHYMNSSGAISSSNMCYNCIAVGDNLYSNGVFCTMPNTTNKQIDGYEMFKTFRGTWNDDADFELTDEAAAQYLGTDGTQVGMYGGMLPYETTPNNPQITKFNVASKSSADGKLSVDIQVGEAE